MEIYLGSLIVPYNYQGHYPHSKPNGLNPKELGHRNFLLRKWATPVNSNFQLEEKKALTFTYWE
jgi:hypothetical protein